MKYSEESKLWRPSEEEICEILANIQPQITERWLRNKLITPAAHVLLDADGRFELAVGERPDLVRHIRQQKLEGDSAQRLAESAIAVGAGLIFVQASAISLVLRHEETHRRCARVLN